MLLMKIRKSYAIILAILYISLLIFGLVYILTKEPVSGEMNTIYSYSEGDKHAECKSGFSKAPTDFSNMPDCKDGTRPGLIHVPPMF